MMSKTHIAAGVATALVVAQPQHIREFGIAILGGSIGGVICDLDVKFNNSSKDAWLGRFLTMSIAAVILLLDIRLQAGIGRAILSMQTPQQWVGLIGFAAVCACCICSSHRSFSHSLLALLLFSCALNRIGSPIQFSFVCGFLSHILLDILNKKPVRIFFPFRKGICLNLFYADALANAIFGVLGLLVIVLTIVRSLLPFGL